MSDTPLDRLRAFQQQLERSIRTRAREFGVELNPPKSTVHLGTNLLSERDVHIPLELFTKTHTMVLGRSGVGKTKFLEQLCRSLIRKVGDDNWSLVVLDGKGGTLQTLADDLFADAVSCLPPDKLVYFNPHDSDRVPGFNVLQCIGRTDPAIRAQRVKEALVQMFHESAEFRPWWENFSMGALAPLIEAGFAITELFDFLALDEPQFREAVLAKVSNPLHRKSWERFTRTHKTYEQATMISSVLIRAKEFLYTELLTAIFGQRENTIDWVRFMDQGGCFVAKLGPGPRFSKTAADFVGRNIVHQILEAAEARRQTNRKPCFVVVDEFERFASPDFSELLDVFRGYGVHLILSCQHFGQLRLEEETLHESTMSNCRIKCFFSLSRKDAEEAALELFTGTFHKDDIIETITSRSFRPHETTRTIESTSESIGESEGSSEQHGESAGVGESETLAEEGDVLVTVGSTQEGTSATAGHSASTTHTQSWSTSRVPWYQYEEFEQVSHRRTWSVEQLKERAIAAIAEQGDRKYHLKLFERPPLPLMTPEVHAPPLPAGRLAEALEVNYNQFRTITDVVHEVRERIPSYLSAIAPPEPHVTTPKRKPRTPAARKAKANPDKRP